MNPLCGTLGTIRVRLVDSMEMEYLLQGVMLTSDEDAPAASADAEGDANSDEDDAEDEELDDEDGEDELEDDGDDTETLE